jgi:hypothetical protein
VDLGKYRYRTPVLTGPWRDSPAQALLDAARARQLRIDGDGVQNIQWIVPGQIEEYAEVIAPQPPPRLAWQ